MRSPASASAVFTPSIMLRLGAGWGLYAASRFFPERLQQDLPGPILLAALAAVIAVIVICSFGVVTQAEHLASRLGDPYGTLILTISIAMIEVILISAVMLGPGDHRSIARDSVLAVSMIILNLVVGAALLVTPRTGVRLSANRLGLLMYLALLLLLSAFAFLLPNIIGDHGQYSAEQQLAIASLTAMVYGAFLYRQMGADRRKFQQIDQALAEADVRGPNEAGPIWIVLRRHRTEVLKRTSALVLLMVPIVLLSHDMAELLNEGLDRLGAPVALSGLLIAMIVFLPETITTIRAAAGGEMQRVSNLCHGALLSTMGLTIPAVLVIGYLTGQPVVLGESAVNLAILALSYLLTLLSFGKKGVRPGLGWLHLALFVVFAGAMLL